MLVFLYEKVRWERGSEQERMRLLLWCMLLVYFVDHGIVFTIAY